ncbi:MAG TPA: hypothetical protein VLG71_02840, partial [Candidatus Limnocylindria bacterium]|nr:hypothetical protein [Candidatus Limnocylindria bacterium]
MRYRRITGGVIFGVCLALFLYFSPVLKPLPQPSGPYAVGIQSFFTADEQRADPYAKTKENRKIVGHIWYPAVPATGKRYEYLGDAMQVFKKIFAQEYHIPGFLSEVLWRGIPTHAYSNATIASTQHAYPVILFSHGLLGLPSQFYSSIIQNIVSHGYIVVGIDHPYFNLVTYYPYGIWVTSNNLATQFHTMKPHEQEAFQMKAIGVYKADMSFVIDYIKHLNEDPESLFYKRCDLNKLIVMGHSAGGTAAIEFCRHDVRCKGAIDLDGWYDQAIDHSPLDKPLL